MEIRFTVYTESNIGCNVIINPYNIGGIKLDELEKKYKKFALNLIYAFRNLTKIIYTEEEFNSNLELHTDYGYVKIETKGRTLEII